MGSLAARIDNGRVTNVHTFRDRALRDKKYKVFVDTLQQITEIYDLTNDLEETNNLISSNNKEVVAALLKFKKEVDKFPKIDAQPIYDKLPNSLYDIAPAELNKKATKGRNRTNHSPKAN